MLAVLVFIKLIYHAGSISFIHYITDTLDHWMADLVLGLDITLGGCQWSRHSAQRRLLPRYATPVIHSAYLLFGGLAFWRPPSVLDQRVLWIQ